MFHLSINTFLAHFHPVFVHLPIGILLVALLIYGISFSKKYAALSDAVPFLLFVGMLGAIASVITGLLLASDGEYDEQAVSVHMWMGIAVAVLSVVILFITGKQKSIIFRLMSALLFLSIVVTGHLGGNLTHGEGYLLSGLSDGSSGKSVRQPIADIGQALAYKDVIRPILEEKCFGCHGTAKQKGKLRMDEFDDLMKGGKNGKIITPGKPAESEIIKRIELPLTDDDHMAPKEKSQVTDNELALLKWWIETGASSVKKVNELPQDDKIKPRLISLKSGTNATADSSPEVIPEEPVKQGDAEAIKTLQAHGTVVIPVAKDRNYLAVTYFGDSSLFEKDLPVLLKLKSQVISLKLAGVGLSASSLNAIGKLIRLVSLNLSNCNVTDEDLINLKSLVNLSTLNLVGNPVTGKGMPELKNFEKLQYLYLYNTKVKAGDWPMLRSTFRNATLDSGGYHVPLLDTDTVIARVQARD